MGQIDGLATGHTVVASGTGQSRTQLGLNRWGHAAVFGGQQLKSQGLQGIPRQQGLRLAIGHMHRGLAPAQHIVVHARHVVVHQGVSVDQLHRTRRAQGRRQHGRT